jgi:hypothetical protein
MHLKPGFMKFDIEGAEHDVFDGQTPEVFASVRTFALELHPVWLRPRGLDPKDTLRSMQRAGFTLHYHRLSNPAYPVDNYTDNLTLFWGQRATTTPLAV